MRCNHFGLGCNCGLGLDQSQIDVIVQNVFDTARSIWPQETAQAQQWIDQQLMKYGLSYARYRSTQLAEQISPWLQNPLVWFAGAFLIWKVIK